MAKQINIIPVNQSANYKDALAYVEGEDRIGGIEEYRSARQELEAQGMTCIEPRNNELLPVGAVVEARVCCMWCGGAYLVGYRMPDESAVVIDHPVASLACQNPGEETPETAGIVSMTEKLQAIEMATTHKHHPGWCNKCQSYCYGDCEA